ncbi:NAD-dependent epimerase/dehydratase family protein [Achromobacter aloeverae]
MKSALIVGGSGLVGGHLRQELLARGGWSVTTTQRAAPPRQPGDHRIVRLDLLDPASIARAMDEIPQVSHVFFLARVWRPGYVIERDENTLVLARLLDRLQDRPELEHVQLIHGLKWYGSVQGPFRTPARETDPVAGRHFYYEQRALLDARRQGRPWHWSTLRPHCVSGVALGSPSNVMLGMAVYATLMKAAGKPLAFPGSEAAFAARLNYTDARLLARAMAWAATAPGARGQDFNIANGDTFSWRQVWPAIARYFGMEAAPAHPVNLSRDMPALASAWRALAARHDLAESDPARLVDWNFMDATLALAWDQTMSLEKIRAHGFTETVHTPAMILDIFDAYRRLRILPLP